MGHKAENNTMTTKEPTDKTQKQTKSDHQSLIIKFLLHYKFRPNSLPSLDLIPSQKNI